MILRLNALLILAAASCLAAEKPLDFWDEEVRIFGVAAEGQHIDALLKDHGKSNYSSKGVALDQADHRVGDLSLVYTPSAGTPARFGFVSGLWGETWALSPKYSLRLWIKTENMDVSTPWKVRLLDADGKTADGELDGSTGEWRELTLPLETLEADAGFDWNHVALLEFDAQTGKKTVIRFDGVRFENGETLIGVTDKPLSQRMAEAEANREKRIEAGLRAASEKKEGSIGLTSAFNLMMLNEDLEWANQMLREELLKSGPHNTWGLFATPAYCRFYYWFSNTNGKYPGRMTKENEKLLLETLWDRTAVKNDIHWARQSTWYLDGSENHDLNAKACNLVSSRIFMNEPEYKDRVYPDYGFGGAYHYGLSGYYGPGIDSETRHGGGRANLSDGKEYTAKDHYAAWLAYMKNYFRGRAERGFFLECGSPTYSKHTLNFVDLAYQYGGDNELHALIGDFITLYWAEWAQVSISGVRGGPKTRHHNSVMEGNGTSALVSFKLGGVANADVWHYWNLINDHQLPPVVWKMILDREGMGCYTYRSRGIGEEENILPRPLGTERSLVVDTDARFLKSTYVTPDYTLGTQMDHPSAVHSHLSQAGRWHGMTFAQNTQCRIVPVALAYSGHKKMKANYSMEGMWQTAHHETSLIVQQARRWYGVHPDWFPANIRDNLPTGIWMGKDWDRKIEKDGWIFVQSGNAYAAVRPVLWDEAYEMEKRDKPEGSQSTFNKVGDDATVRLRTDAYRWNEEGDIIVLEENYMAVVIEAGRKADYPTLEGFMADVLDNPLALYKTVVPGDHILVYTGCGGKEMTFGCAAPQIPTVGGVPIDYSYPMTFDSPTLKSEYKSGKIHMEYGGETLDLDFSEKPWWAFWR